MIYYDNVNFEEQNLGLYLINLFCGFHNDILVDMIVWFWMTLFDQILKANFDDRIIGVMKILTILNKLEFKTINCDNVTLNFGQNK